MFDISSSTTGNRTEDQKLLPGPDPCAYAIINEGRSGGGPFGASIAIDGTIVVGAPRAASYDGDGQVNDGDVAKHGTVHVYTRRSHLTWVWAGATGARCRK